MVLDVAQPEARARVDSQSARLGWGLVDAILALVLLPFGVWFLVIDRMVAGIAWVIDHATRQTRA
jgi:hypothetical protein